MNFCFIFKLTRVDVGNVSKKGKHMKGIFTRWFFNLTLSIYLDFLRKTFRMHLIVLQFEKIHNLKMWQFEN